jgi:hypothetical protein
MSGMALPLDYFRRPPRPGRDPIGWVVVSVIVAVSILLFGLFLLVCAGLALTEAPQEMICFIAVGLVIVVFGVHWLIDLRRTLRMRRTFGHLRLGSITE